MKTIFQADICWEESVITLNVVVICVDYAAAPNASIVGVGAHNTTTALYLTVVAVGTLAGTGAYER